MLANRFQALNTFITNYKDTLVDFYDSAEGQAVFQSAMVNLLVRLAQGEDFDDVMAQTVATLLATPQVYAWLDDLFEGTNVQTADYALYLKNALSTVMISAIVNGGENIGQVALNSSVQQAITYGISRLDNPLLMQGQVLTAIGAGLVAGVATLANSILSGNGINQQVVGQAVMASGTAAATVAITNMLVGTASAGSTSGLLGWGGYAAGPIGIAVGVVIGLVVQKLLTGSKTYHDETISHSIEVQPDGSYKVIGLREAGSLLRTTGNTNDDFYGNDSADDSTGHDVIVGNGGKNEAYGRGGHDMIEGRANDDYIDAGTGDDHVEAGTGNDYIDGAAGSDRLYGQAGNDHILGGAGDDNILGGDGDDQIEGNEGNDLLYGGTGADTIAGGIGNDRIDGGTGNDTLNGEVGDDELNGGLGDDIVHGNDGKDILFGNDGNDDLRGDNGDDLVFGESGVDQLYGGDGADVLDGGTDSDILFGGLGNDTLHGSFGDDALYGEIGNDLLIGGRGNDTLDGGDGDDVFVYVKNDGQDIIEDTAGANKIKLTDLNVADVSLIARVGDDLVITFDTLNSITVKNHFLGGGVATIEFANNKFITVASMTFNATTGVGSYSLNNNGNALGSYSQQYTNYQQLVVPFQVSTVLSTGWLKDNYDTSVLTDAYQLELYNDVQVKMWQKKAGFFGMRVSVGYYDYYETFLRASGYSDRVVGNIASETIDGGSGNDQLYGNVGNDTILGGIDHDLIFGGAGNDIVSGQSGNDKVFGGTGLDNLSGNEGNDTLYGEFENDTLNGDTGEDFLDGGDGSDLLYGGSGRDILYGGSGNDTLDGGDDDDFLSGGEGTNILNGGAGNDLIIGGIGNDTIGGGIGDDTILGGGGTDTISGNSGDDIIVLSGRMSDYAVKVETTGVIKVVDFRPGVDGTLYLSEIEKIQFADQVLSLSETFPETPNIIIPQGITFNGKVDLPAGYTFTLEVAAGKGTAVINSNGTYTYTAPTGFVGMTSFRYRMVSASGVNKFADISVNVLGAAAGTTYTSGSESLIAPVTMSSGSWDDNLRHRSRVLKLSNGGHALIWASQDSDGTSHNVYHQVFNASGTAVTAVVRANSVTANSQFIPNGFSLNNGGYVAIWFDSTSQRTVFRRFDNNGTAQTTDVYPGLPAGTTNAVYAAGIELVSGNLGFLWSSLVNGYYDIYYQQYTATGTSVGSAVKINTLTAGNQILPSALRLANGNLAVIFNDQNGMDSSSDGIYLQIITDAGLVVSTEQLVNSFTSNPQFAPTIDLLASGGFIVTWTSSGQDGAGHGIYGQLYNSVGNKVGTEFRINTATTGDQRDSSVTALADGGFFVVWQSSGQDGDANGIYGQRYNASGVAVGSEVRINDTTIGNQYMPDVVELNNGDLLFTWESWQNSTYNVIQKRLTPQNTFLNAPGTEVSENIIGGATNDALNGYGGNDTIMGNGGNDIIDGGIGRNTAQFSGNLANYAVSIENSTITVTDLRSGSPDGIDTLTNIQTLRFADQDVDWATLFLDKRDLIIPQSKTYNGKVALLTGETTTLISAPAVGTLTLASNGDYTYSSPSNYAGDTTFKYKVTAVNGITKTYTVNVNIDPYAAVAYTLGTEQTLVTNVPIQNLYYDEFENRERPEVITLAGGGSVFVWTRNDSNVDGGQNVYYEVYNAAGTLVTPITRVNASTGDFQMDITGVALADGGFALVWMDLISNPNLHSGSAVWKRFNASGVAQTSEIRVTPSPTPPGVWDCDGGNIVQLQDGSLAVIWAGQTGNSDYNVFMSRFDLNGNAIGSSVQINTTYSAGRQTVPLGTVLTDGNVAVVWRDVNEADSSSDGIFLKIMSPTGVAVTTEAIVNTYTTNTQGYPAIASLVAGGFVVTWSSYGQDTSGWGIYAQRFDNAGNKQGSEFKVNVTTAGDQVYSMITGLSDGGFYITWQHYFATTGNFETFGKRFDANGSAIGGDILINNTLTNNQETPAVAQLNNGDIIVTWRSFDGTNYKVMRRNLVSTSHYINAIGSDNFELLIGDISSDRLTGGGGNDILIGDSGNDTLDGGLGNDIARYSGNLANYTVTLNGSSVTVVDNRSGTPDGSDALTNIEALSFADQDIVLTNLFPEIRPITLPFGSSYNGKIDLPAGYSMAIQTAPTQGVLTLGANGNYTYSAPAGFSGATSFQYKLVTPQGVTQIATANVTVLPVSSGVGSFTAGTEQSLGNLSIINSYDDQNDVRERPSTVKLNGGGYVLTWTNANSDGTGRNVYYQVYNSSGVATTAVTLASTTTAGSQMVSTGIPLANGGFALMWMDADSGSGTYTGTPMWRMFNAFGVPQSGELKVMPTPTGGSVWNAAAGNLIQLADGTFAVVWSGQMGSTDNSIYLSRFDASGISLSSPIMVNNFTTDRQSLSQAALLSNGNIAVIWRDPTQDGSSDGIYFRIMSPSSGAVTSEQRINTTTSNSQNYGSIAALATGGFVVTWASIQDGSGWGIYGQRYNAAGTKVGTEFLINTVTTGDQLYPVVTGLSDGGLFVTWQSNGQDGSGTGIYGKRFDLNGNTVGSEILINSTTTGNQETPSVSQLGNGDLLFTWRSMHTSNYQIMQRRLVAPVGSGAYVLTGTASSEILVGGVQADTLLGLDGNDILQGGQGADALSGGGGNDTYRFGLGDGADVIDNQDSVGTDILSLGAGIDRHNLWFQQSGYDLKALVLGTTDSVTLQNWFTGDAQKVDEIDLSNGYKLNKASIDQLVNAMASFNPQALGTVTTLTDLPQSIQTTLAASWTT